MAEGEKASGTSITGLSHDGRGVGRIDGTAVFVPGLIPGDCAQVRIVRRRTSFAEGKAVALLAASPDRVEPFCADYDCCGGCSLQHMSYPAQLAWKRTRVADALARLGGVTGADALVMPVIGMENPMEYRHKVAMPVRRAGIGFYARESHDVVAFSECRIQHPAGLAVREAVSAWMAREGVPAYDDRTRSGLLRHIVVRTSRSTGEVQVVLVLSSRELADASGQALLPGLDRLAEELEAGLAAAGVSLAGLTLNSQPLPGGLILGESWLCVHGQEDIEETMDGLSFRLSPASFFQVNPEQAAILYRIAADWAAGDGSETVYDLYSGTGTIACFLARRAGRVIGIESEPAAVMDARANAERNGLADKVTFVEGKVEDVLAAVIKARAEEQADIIAGSDKTTVVMDPPRRGCDAALLRVLVDMQPNSIVYVSCDPSTLARDVRKLADGGYRVVRVQPVDMFPWTEHVESVVLMSRVTF